jgi:hypothetical protein
MSSKHARGRGAPRRRPPPAPTPNRTPILVIGGIAALAVVATLVALAISSQAPEVAQPAASVEVRGDALPALVAGGTDPALGMALPRLSGTGIDGEPVAIGPEDGPMAIVVLAHWCPHCQAELPRLVDWLEANDAPDGVRVVGLSTGIDVARPNYPPSAWLEREGWEAPTLIDDAASTALEALGLTSFPGFVVVDGDGRIAARTTGEIGGEQFGALLASVAP